MAGLGPLSIERTESYFSAVRVYVLFFAFCVKRIISLCLIEGDVYAKNCYLIFSETLKRSGLN